MDISLSVYEHAAMLIGKTPWEASRDGDLMYEAHAEAYRVYHHVPVMPGIDIYNLEVEAYGAVIEPREDTGIPAVTKHPYKDTADILKLRPLDAKRDGRIPLQIAVAKRLIDAFPEAVVRVPVCGPFSIASNLVGFNNLITDVALRPELVAEALMHLVEGQLAFARGIKEAGVGVAFFESAACPPMLSPKSFRQLELPALTKLMRGIDEITGTVTACIIGGNTVGILEPMLETGTRSLICPFETDQPKFLEKMKAYPDIMVRVNCDLRIIATGPWERIKADADRVIALCRDREKVCIGTGALPYETPPENVLRLIDYVRAIPA